MKPVLIILLSFFALRSAAQNTPEQEVLALSNHIFQWEVAGKTDSLDRSFDDKFVVINTTGESQTKAQYLARLRGGSFVHNSIEVQDNTAIVSDNTAVVTGNGNFTVTNSGQRVVLRLAYLEVFTRPNGGSPWKALAIHASVRPAEHQQ